MALSIQKMCNLVSQIVPLACLLRVHYSFQRLTAYFGKVCDQLNPFIEKELKCTHPVTQQFYVDINTSEMAIFLRVMASVSL